MVSQDSTDMGADEVLNSDDDEADSADQAADSADNPADSGEPATQVKAATNWSETSEYVDKTKCAFEFHNSVIFDLDE